LVEHLTAAQEQVWPSPRSTSGCAPSLMGRRPWQTRVESGVTEELVPEAVSGQRANDTSCVFAHAPGKVDSYASSGCNALVGQIVRDPRLSDQAWTAANIAHLIAAKVPGA
jgi:hypothetical protein